MLSTITSSQQRQCLSCGHALRGRIDKKFCNDQCRSEHHNRKRQMPDEKARPIARALQRNRHILQHLLGEEDKKVVSREALLDLGFRFRYHTHRHENRRGAEYIFCFEFGYLQLGSERILLLRAH